MLSGNAINVGSAIYSSGGIQVAACSFAGQGSICAEKNIQLAGNAIKNNTSASVCIYSVNGDISFATSGLTIYGTLYAPNGTIGIYANNITIYGRVIAKNIIITGSNVKIIAGANDLDFLPGGTVSLCEYCCLSRVIGVAANKNTREDAMHPLFFSAERGRKRYFRSRIFLKNGTLT